MQNYAPDNSEWFVKNNLTPPKAATHGTEEDIRAKLTPLKVLRWRQQGNQLIGETEWGEVVNHLPTNLMLEGTDKHGLPILKKIV